MRRRTVLRAGLALAGVAGTGIGSVRAGPGVRPGGAMSPAYGPMGRVSFPGAADCRVSPDGETAFVAIGDGFVAVALPSLRVRATVQSIEADREGGPLAGIGDLAVDGDRLLVPGPAHRQPDRTAGFALFDIADPDRPEQVAFHETAFPIHNAALADGRAYLTAGLTLVVVDVAGDEPVEVGRWSLADVDERWGDVAPSLRVLHDIRVRDDLAVLSQWDAGTWLVDVGSPDAVTVVGRAGGRTRDELAALADERIGLESVQLPGNHHSAAVSDDGSVLAVGAEAFDAVAGDGTGGPGGIDLYDINDPSSPGHLASIDPLGAADETRGGTWTTAHDFTFDRNRLLSAWYQGGVRIHDVSEPAEPHQMTAWRQPAEAAFWTARPARDDTFVAPSTTLPGGGLQSGLYLFPNRPGDQANPPSLTEPTPRVATSTPTATDTATPSPSPSPTRAPGQPGFGYLASVGGLAGLAGWRYWRQGR